MQNPHIKLQVNPLTRKHCLISTCYTPVHFASADVIDLPDTPTPSTPNTNTQTPPTSGGSVHRTPGSNEANKIKKVALKSVPKTSDSADIIIYAGLLFASIIGLSILGVSGRKILNK